MLLFSLIHKTLHDTFAARLPRERSSHSAASAPLPSWLPHAVVPAAVLGEPGLRTAQLCSDPCFLGVFSERQPLPPQSQ